MFGRRTQRDFDDEVQAHIELEAERLRGQGMSEAAAALAARRRFGNVGVAQDRFYKGQRFASLQDAGRDLKYAWRALMHSRAFLAASVATLALAMGALSGMFSVVKTVLIEPLAFPHADRLVVISGTAPGSDRPERYGPGLEFYLHYKERSALLDGIFVFNSGTSTFRAGDRVERIAMVWPSNDIYATLGIRPVIGRFPVPEDRDGAVMISDQLWDSWFGRDPSVIGKSYFVSDGMKQVIGVMPPEFAFPSETAMLWVSGEVQAAGLRPGQLGNRPVARMKDGVTRGQLAAELTRLAKELPARFGGPPSYARVIEQHRTLVDPLHEVLVGETTSQSLWLLLAAVFVVLLIACANVANLFAVRAEGRAREMAVRRAIGATRTQLVRLQMAEAFLVALIAGVIGVGLSLLVLPLFISAAPGRIPRIGQAGFDPATLGSTLAIVLLATLACGVLPALRASSAALTPLRQGSRGATGRASRVRNVLVIGQTALGLMLLIGSALLLQSFMSLRHVDPGYDTTDIYTFQFAPEQPQLTDGPAIGRMHLDVMERLRGLPGVRDVGVVNHLPLDEGMSSARYVGDASDRDAETPLNINYAGGDYFSAMGISLLQGRAFTSHEAVATNTSAILSRSAAQRLWPNSSAIGRRFRRAAVEDAPTWFTVVGVVEDVKQFDWRVAGEHVVYFPLTGPSADSWLLDSPAYVVKSPQAAALGGQVRALIGKLAPEAPVYREYTMEFLTRRSMLQLSFTTLTLGTVSFLALVLGVIGLYGVLSYVVAERRREIGVRLALGATVVSVQRVIVSQALRIVLAGVAIGVAGALASTRLLGSFLFNVQTVDPLVFFAMSVAMLAIGLLASYVPARRAGRVNPIESLRAE